MNLHQQKGTPIRENLAQCVKLIKASAAPVSEIGVSGDPETSDIAHFRPVLSREQITSLRTWNEVLAAYRDAGAKFSKDSECLTLVSADWEKHRCVMFHEALEAPCPERLPFVEVKGERNDTLRLYGIVHVECVHPTVKPIMDLTLEREPLLFAEQELGARGGRKLSHGIELPDPFVRGVFRGCIRS